MTLRQLYLQTKRALAQAGSPSQEAALLFAHFLGIDRHRLILDGEKPADEARLPALRQAVQRRAAGEPLQYLLGEWEFAGLPFAVGPGVLIPREDTETLLEHGLAFAGAHPVSRAADLCSGSGCLAISLASRLPGCPIYALEYSPDAFRYLSCNIQRHRTAQVQALQADVLTAALPAPVDLILANPPYIPTETLCTLQREVQREPAMALDGGADGLRFYRGICRQYFTQLNPGGMLAFEVGFDQADAVAALLREAGYYALAERLDLQGIRRVVSGRRP